MKTLLVLALVLAPSFSSAEDSEKAATVETAKPAEKAEASSGTYTGEALTIQKRMESLFESSKKVNGSGAERTKARAAIEGVMDWDKVAEVCLGTKKYKSESAGNKTQFKTLLKDVIIKTAYTRLDKFWADGTTYDFPKIDVKGNQASVVSNFHVKGDSFALEYYMSKKGADWYIWDISFENERYSVNINEQIEAFLKERGFPNLLEKLKKRRTDLDEEASKKS